MEVYKKHTLKIDWVLIASLALLFLGYLFFHDLTGGSLFSHNPWDSYTLQALAWRDGHTYLAQDYSWLELAVYNGHYYVSFPPVPSLLMLPLTFFAGADTPNNFMVMLYALLSVSFAYQCFRKIGTRRSYSIFWAVFLVMGSNMLWMSTSGGVWFQAQSLNMLFCFAAVYCILCKKNTVGLALLALAVGCRPFSVCLLAAAFLFICIRSQKEAPLQKKLYTVALQLKHLIIPILIGCCYLYYNAVRFGNPLEFGHNYLLEFSDPDAGQFGFQYIMGNATNIFLRPVSILSDGSLSYPAFDGFLFYIANPIFVVWFVFLVQDIAKKRLTAEKLIIVAGLAANMLLLLLHKTFGGWQFGARYTVDLLPYVLGYLLLCKTQKPAKWILFLGAFAVLFNMYGALAMNFKEGLRLP
ncbi:MAG: hypothetical protein VB082_04195 [Christensenella sp.]|nr:hypothetical protein [Christensenella sp.]